MLDQGQPGLLLKLLLLMSLWGADGLLRILPLFIMRTIRVILARSRHYIFDLWLSVLIRRWYDYIVYTHLLRRAAMLAGRLDLVHCNELRSRSTAHLLLFLFRLVILVAIYNIFSICGLDNLQGLSTSVATFLGHDEGLICVLGASCGLCNSHGRRLLDMDSIGRGALLCFPGLFDTVDICLIVPDRRVTNIDWVDLLTAQVLWRARLAHHGSLSLGGSLLLLILLCFL